MMDEDELNPEFIQKMKKIKKEESIKINDFIKRYDLDEDKLELSEQTKQEIAKSRAEYKAGKTHSLKDVKKSLKVK